MLSNLRAHAAFLTILLVFCCLIAHSAAVDTDGIPEAVSELLSGKTTDFTGLAIQIPEHQLPTALAAAKLLKFRALHGETSLSSNEADAFETILLDRMSTARQVTFSQNETCRKKIEQHEIMFDGQKLLVPAHFVADTNLAVISCQPKGEAGSLFPDFSIEGFSQSPLTEITLAIDGQAINAKNILIKQSENAFELSYRTPATPDSLLSIGTHTAEITINNQSGETVKQQWSFTVGIYNVPTPPLPADVKVIGEITLPGDKLLPGQKLSGSLRAVVYEDTAGNRYIEYQLTTASGQIIKSRNLAFIGRKMLPGRAGADDLELSPKTTHAFIGNVLAFSYTWIGPGQVLSTDWLITSGNISTTENSVKMAGNTSAKCTIVVEEAYTDNAGNQTSFQYEVSAFKTILALEIFANISSNRMLLVSNNATASFALKSTTDCIVNYSNETGLLQSDLAEGKVYTFNSGATLKAERLHWKIYVEEGSPEVEDPVATTTQLLFTKPGFAELVLDVKLVWQQYGETYESDFKPETSGLYAFYPVKGSAQFSKYPQGQLSVAARHIAIESFEFEIKQQKRIITASENTELDEPIHICSSALWPASSPIMVFKAIPLIFNAKTGREIETVEPFVFQTPMVISDDSIELNLGGEFHSGEMSSQTCRTVIGKLPTIPVYDENEVLQLQLQPADKVTIYEGQEQIFKAEVAPLPGFGQGVYSDVSQTLDVLNGYEVRSVEHVLWYEEPLGDEGDWKSKALRGLDFSHVFKPFIGPGSYTMNCGIVMNLIETDSADEVLVYLENVVPVDALPGLRIFSPINELAYPVNVSLKVKTSFDKDPKIWKAIKWRLNGKEYHHGLDEAPFFIDLNRTGKWSLQAELTIKNPETDEDMLLKDQVDFIVNPVEISLTPTRKVFDLSTQKSQELFLNITLNGKKVEKPGKPVEWNDDGLKAVVDPIEWFSATAPNGCATVNHDEENLTANVNFADAGAATVLATVTVRLTDGEEYFRRRHKGFEDEFEEPIFAFPAVRADLWAVAKPVWEKLTSNLPGEQFPKQAVSPAGRTFTIKNGVVLLDKETYEWSPQTEFETPIAIPAAITDSTTLPATCNKVKFEWSCADNDPSNDSTFIPTFKKWGSAIVKLKSSLVFDNKDEVLFAEKIFPVAVEDIETLVQYYIEPKTFQMRLGETKKFNFFINPIESPPVLTIHSNDSEFYILNGIYKISLEEVDWHYEVSSNSSSIVSLYDFILNPPETGNYKVLGKAKCWIVEFPFSPNEIKWPWSPESASFGSVTGLDVQIFGNNEPLETGEYHLGQEIELSYTISNLPEDVVIEKQKWIISSPTPKSFSISDDLNKGHVETVTEAEFKKPAVKFFLYDFFLTHEEDVDFGRKTGTLVLTYAGKEFPYPFFIPYKKPYLKNVKVEPRKQNIEVRLDLEDVTWKIGFHDTDKIGIQAHAEIFNPTNQSYTITVTHLIKRNDERSFFSASSTPEIHKQFKKTIPIGSPESEPPEFWLDTYFPSADREVTFKLPPHGNLPKAILCDDIPRYKIYFEEPGVPIFYETKTDFIVYFWAIPEPFDKSAWCPIKRMVWHWSGNTSYDPQKDKWENNQNNYSVHDLEITPVDFPKWIGFAHPDFIFPDDTILPEQPIWRDKNEN